MIPNLVAAPSLPVPRGPLPETVITALRGGALAPVPDVDADAFGEDLQLALYVCYELHYQGFCDDDLAGTATCRHKGQRSGPRADVQVL